jgi:2-dehydropantoate 2-reductase
MANPVREAPPRNDWLVLGTGAMACLWTASLLGAGTAVRMRAHRPAATEAYHELTLLTAAGGQRFAVRLEAEADRSAVRQLLVCTKAGAVQAALEALRPRIAADACIVLLQNGMGYQEPARALLPRARVYAAATTEGAWCEAPLRVHHAGRGATVVGRWPEGGLDEARSVAVALGGGLLALQPTATIAAELWRKLAVSCAINPLTALHACANGALLDDPGIAREFDALCAEIARVLAALGQPAIAAGVASAARQVARATAANRSSMLQDLRAGRRTEIDWITGHLCAEARRCGVPCPLNDALLAAVHAREAR